MRVLYIYIYICIYTYVCVYTQHCSCICVCIGEYLNMLYKNVQSVFRPGKNTFNFAKMIIQYKRQVGRGGKLPLE